MSFHRVILVALATLFTVGMTSLASACCGGWGYSAPIAYPVTVAPVRLRRLWRLRRLRRADGGRGLCAAGCAGADRCRLLAAAPGGGPCWSWIGCGSCGWRLRGCGNCGGCGGVRGGCGGSGVVGYGARHRRSMWSIRARTIPARASWCPMRPIRRSRLRARDRLSLRSGLWLRLRRRSAPPYSRIRTIVRATRTARRSMATRAVYGPMRASLSLASLLGERAKRARTCRNCEGPLRAGLLLCVTPVARAAM